MAVQASSSSSNGECASSGDKEIIRELMTIYLDKCATNGNNRLLQQQQQQQQQNGRSIIGGNSSGGPLMKELSSAVIGLTGDYEHRYKDKLNSLRANWIIDAHCPRESFQQVLDNVFVDNCNWGRVVTIFVFASMFLQQCQRQGIADVTQEDVCVWSVDYISERVLPWIKRNGDWMGLIRFYKDAESGVPAALDGGAVGGGNDSGVLARLLTVAGAGIAIASLTSFLRA